MVNKSVGICGAESDTAFFDVLEHEYEPGSSPCVPFAVSASLMLKFVSYFVFFISATCAIALLVLSKLLIPVLVSRLRKENGRRHKQKLFVLYAQSCVFGFFGSLLLAGSSSRRFYFALPLNTLGGSLSASSFFLAIALLMLALVSFALTFQEITIASMQVPLINLPSAKRVIGIVSTYCAIAVGTGSLLVSVGYINSGFAFLRMWHVPSLPCFFLFGYFIPAMMQPIIDSIEEAVTNASRFSSSTLNRDSSFSSAANSCYSSVAVDASSNYDKKQESKDNRSSTTASKKKKSTKSETTTESRRESRRERENKKFLEARNIVLKAQKMVQFACASTIVLVVSVIFSPLIHRPYLILSYHLFFNLNQMSMILIMTFALYRKYRAVSKTAPGYRLSKTSRSVEHT